MPLAKIIHANLKESSQTIEHSLATDDWPEAVSTILKELETNCSQDDFNQILLQIHTIVSLRLRTGAWTLPQ